MHVHKLVSDEHLDRRVHGVLTIVWFLLAIPAVLLWRESVPFLVYVSVYANFVGHWSSYQAAKAEKKIEEVVADSTGNGNGNGNGNGSGDAGPTAGDRMVDLATSVG